MRPPRGRAGRLGLAVLAVAGVLSLAATTTAGKNLSGSLASKQATAQRLRSQVAAESRRLADVQGSLHQIQTRLGRIEADLSRKEGGLAATQATLRRERTHLVRLQLQLAAADRALASNLLSQYESDPPDAITVILNSHGFADMMDRLEFVRKAKQHDKAVIQGDRRARTVVIAAATRLGDLERRQQSLAEAVRVRRDAVDRIRIRLDDRAIRIERARSAKSARLGQVEADRRRLTRQLSTSRGQAGRTFTGGVLRSGGFVFPMPGGAASSPGSWSNDQGVDISAAGHTPLLAVGSGTIVLHGIGGFGPSAPVLHLDSPISGYSYVYYGHAGPGNMVPIGSHVSAGSVISEVGAGIVGISTGPHLEIGFADASGTPIGGGSASTMHALLLGAYHG